MGSIPLYAPAPGASMRPSSTICTSECPPSKKRKSWMQDQAFFIQRSIDSITEVPAVLSARGNWLKPGEKEKMNTARTNNWAINVFQEWKTMKNQTLKNLTANSEDCIPDDILDRNYGLDDVSVDPLVHWLPVLLDEVRSKDGRIYPPASLQGLLFAIVRAMRQKNPLTPNFMNRKDLRFKALHDKLDNAFLEYEEHSSGAQKRSSLHMTSITPEQENQLWEQGILGNDSPFKLLRAVFYHMSKAFFIKGAAKHRCLKLSQFKRETNPDRYTYIAAESGPKKKSYGIQVNSSFPPVYHANPAARERCLVYLLDLYISKLPDDAFTEDIFYHRPLAFVPKDVSCPWYGQSPVGLERLRTMAREIFNASGILKKNQSQLPIGVSPSGSINGQSLHLNELPSHQEKVGTETVQEFTSSMPEILTCDHYHQSKNAPAGERFQDALLEEPLNEQCEKGEHTQELEYQGLFPSIETSTHGEFHERPTQTMLDSREISSASDDQSELLSPEQRATMVSNLFSSEKNGSELHIYDSGPYSMYIFMQRHKNKRSNRQGSCPPVNV